ncbi:hypothetical protein ANANG_G00034130 [Anguilla anguilla]|uniref:Uncharacterized protein n=1 Tax=Anguilla anguilla TaxID=7936 RepID=A0A9D3MSA3_ANGAN|nr:hypothetical protein ANANG_G00034130 [Anguilla anguilla]
MRIPWKGTWSPLKKAMLQVAIHKAPNECLQKAHVNERSGVYRSPWKVRTQFLRTQKN